MAATHPGEASGAGGAVESKTLYGGSYSSTEKRGQKASKSLK